MSSNEVVNKLNNFCLKLTIYNCCSIAHGSKLISPNFGRDTVICQANKILKTWVRKASKNLFYLLHICI